jgi:hypothetical protein
MQPINLYSPKGGSGVSVTATLLAVTLSATRQTTLVADSRAEFHELCGVLGATTPDADHTVITGTLQVVVGPYRQMPGVAVVLSSHGPVEGARNLMVLRNDYLAMRRAVQGADTPDGLIIITEPGRALSASDAERAIGAPVLVEMPIDPSVARCVDAGLVASLPPRVFTGYTASIVGSEDASIS